MGQLGTVQDTGSKITMTPMITLISLLWLTKGMDTK